MTRIWRIIIAAAVLTVAGAPAAAEGTRLRFAIRSDPKTLNPLLVDEESGELVRYLTSGVLMRINRVTQKAEPELATAWRWLPGNKSFELSLRRGVRFSDGAAFTAHDVAYTFERIMDSSIKSPLADAFRSPKGDVIARIVDTYTVTLTFPNQFAGIERLLDHVPILSKDSQQHGKPVLGPFIIQSHAPGSHLLLARNPNYWKRDTAGRPLPYLSAIRLDIQSNRDIEALRFRRGELDMIRGVDPELFNQLERENGRVGIQMGAGFDSEMLWFNQVPGAPIGRDRKSWFRSRAFRKAISHAINRADMVRLVFHGYAEPAFGPYNAANRLFYNRNLEPDAWSLDAARKLLKQAGFTWRSDTLVDPMGTPVEFSIVTNAGSKVRTRMATMIQQDLKALGVKVAVVPLDFPSLIERITKTYAYEACLLGLVNVDADPSGQMNVWMSSGANHQWNPRQAIPQTDWEAEIDRLMLAQASTADMRVRKASFDRVQQVISQQVPFIYLVSTSALAAAKPTIRNLAPSPMRPHLVWNIEHLRIDEATKR